MKGEWRVVLRVPKDRVATEAARHSRLQEVDIAQLEERLSSQQKVVDSSSTIKPNAKTASVTGEIHLTLQA